jgi:hypothetical protein
MRRAGAFDERHNRALTEPPLFPTRFRSPQPFLWNMSDVEWRVVLRLRPYKRRPQHGQWQSAAVQERLFP